MGRRWYGLDLHYPAPCRADLPDIIQALLLDAPPIAVEEFPPPRWSEPSDGSTVAIETLPPERWRVVYADARSRDRARALFVRALSAHGVRIDAVDVPDEDWAARSQADLTPVQVGRIVVCPPWDVREVGEHAASLQSADPTPQFAVVIQPSMGFGTGHHPTTRLCLQALQATELATCRVLDVGTGSGVLALAACRLGAQQVTALDCDPDALSNARKNARLNGINTIRFVHADLGTARIEPADVVMANLTGALLVSQASVLARAVRPGGHLIISGFLEAEAPTVIPAFASAFRVFRSFEEAAWLACLLDA